MHVWVAEYHRARMETNVLYYGDNLPILREYIADESVDLVYLDPPFNSNRDYNVIFKDESGRGTDAQLTAFEDTWHWGPEAERLYAYLTNTAKHEGRVPSTVSTIVAALRGGIGENEMLAYLVEMTVRLVELRRVLKPSGTLWLHCDPTASHYLKLVLDAIFGPRAFRNELIWKRTSAHSDARQGGYRLGRVHDVLLYYGKGDKNTWNVQYQPYTDEHVTAKYRSIEQGTGRRYTDSDLTANKPGGDTSYEWKGVRPPEGRYWAFSKANMEEFERQGRLIYTRTGFPRYKRYLDEMQGVPLQDIWADIAPVNAMARERLGWDTQKPLALLERIIEASSNPGDVVLDPFCGCGTALVAAQKLGRQWVGIDITYLSIAVMRARLMDSFGLTDVPVIGQPTEVEGARQLLMGAGLEGQYQFQWWALNLVGAKPMGGVQKKGADQGIDGIITFTDHLGELRKVIVSVKSGKVNSGMVQQLKGAMETHQAAMGLFITLEETTAPMRQEAATAGAYTSELTGRDYERLQLLTIRDLLEEHKKPDLPLFIMPAYQKAQKVKGESGVEQQDLALG